MKVDFHSHSRLSKSDPFDLNFFQQAVSHVRKQGMAAITITDHHDSVAYEGIYAALDQHYPYNGHYYQMDGVRYYPGLEVAIREGPHLLVSAPRDDILTFYDRLRSHLDPETYPTLEEFFVLQAGLDPLNIFAHPLRPRREIEKVDPALISNFDALDLNAKDLVKYGQEHRQLVEQLGHERGLPVVAGSDSHHFYQLGSVYNDFQQPFETVADLRQLIQAGAYTVGMVPDLNQRVETASELKRLLKEANKE